jgi:hypothetical protein
MGIIGIEPSCSNVLQVSECDTIFIQTKENFLVNDVVSGFVKVDGLRTLIVTSGFSGSKNTAEVPNTIAIMITLSNIKSGN